MGTVLSKEYEEQLNSLNSLKYYYEKYKAPIQTKKDDLTLCIKLIDEYLKSDLKLELKKEFLSQSQELATKHNVTYIKTEDFRDLHIYKLDYTGEFLKPNKKDLIFCRDYVDRILQNIPDPEKSQEYLKYTSL